jgi:N utilization substance protein A
MDALDCDEVIAHLLVAEGFTGVEELGSVSAEELASIEGFDKDLAGELISRAVVYLEKRDRENLGKVIAKKIDEKIIELGVFSNEDLLILAEHKIKKLDNLADLSADELMELLHHLDENTASDIIMKSREHWFK